MKRSKSQRRGGFSLIEVMISLAVMLAGSLGAILGLMAANRELREGQLRQYKMVLADASVQRARLRDKVALQNAAVAVSPLPSTVTAISAAPWAVDPTPVVAGDLSTGAYFEVFPNGQIRHLTASTTPAVAANTPCNAVPEGVYCRELVLARGAPVAAPGPITAGGQATTVWVRVSRRGEPADSAVLSREVILQ